LWWIDLPKRRVRSSIFVQIRDIAGNLLKNRCKNEVISRMFGNEERRLRRKKEIRTIALDDGW